MTGLTTPFALSPAALDEWVRMMVLAGHDNGGGRLQGPGRRPWRPESD